MVFVGGIVGAGLAPQPGLSTLPVAAQVVGTAVAAVPAALLMERTGRRAGFLSGALVGCGAMLLAMYAVGAGSFALFCAASALVGANGAFMQQYRYAAAESVAPAYASRAIAVVLMGGVAGGVLGPEIGRRARDLLAEPYAGGFLVMAGVYVVVALLLVRLREPRAARGDAAAGDDLRPLRVLVTQPAFILAAAAAMTAYMVMSFIMTATPVSMHVLDGHSLDTTAVVIQAHVAAMYLPSLATGVIVDRLGTWRVVLIGIALLAGCIALGAGGHGAAAYGIGLALLGVGWNFLFLGGTVLLTQAARPAERFRVQAANDFLVFGVQAAASLGAGAMLYRVGWQNLNLIAAAPVVVLLGLLLGLRGRVPGAAAPAPASAAPPAQPAAD